MKNAHKVLMTLMGMEIGGAETHVLELSKTLKRMGVDVYVVSNGGVYVQELEACGIKHYRVPMHNKQLVNIFSSYRALKKIILDNDIQLVHAHARIPAFICGLLQKRLKFKLVTSAHGSFSVAFPFNFLSNWGDKTIAVSPHIRDYLLQHYNVKERNVSLTVNGIDTEKFAPHVDAGDILAELGLSPTSTKIVSLSRMDKDSSVPPRVLADIAEDLLKAANKEIEIILVGSGEDFDEIKAKADAVNARVGRKLVYMTGQRTDVNKFMALADIFVNVSRAAMEAMAAGVPTILAGTYGYLGIFNEATKRTAIETNFTARDHGETTPEKLLKDVLVLLSDNNRTQLGELSRNLICTEYSLERMAQDAVSVYDGVFAQDKPTNIVISGYYGHNNSGDDIMLKSIIQNLREYKQDLGITVLSLKPKETRVQFKVDTVHRFNLFAVFMRLRKAKLLISGGGNLMQDETSTQSLLYYLWVINTARFLGVKNMLYANGIGPVRRPGNIARVRRSLNKVELITLRESGSFNVLNEMGITTPETHITADAAFALLSEGDDNLQLHKLGITDNYFCIALRPWATNPPDMEAQIASFADYLVDTYGYQAVFVPMRPEQDREIAHRTMALMKHPAVYVEPQNYNVARQMLGMASFAVCMRLHALIYATEMGVPAIGLVYGPKVRGFMDAMGQPWHMPVEETNAATLVEYSDKIHADKQQISVEIMEAGARLRQLAARNTQLCIQLLER